MVRGMNLILGLDMQDLQVNISSLWAGAAVEIPWYAYKVLGQLGPKLFFFRLSEVKDTVEDYLDVLEGNTFAARKQVILPSTGRVHRHL